MVMAPSVLDTSDIYITEHQHTTSDSSPENIDHGERHPVSAEMAPKDMAIDLLKKKARTIDIATCDPGEEDPFYVADLGEIYRQHVRWKMNLGRVKPFYAIKCNPDSNVLRLMALLGNGFDCASKAEIDDALNTGVDPSRIIYAQPCKTASYLRYAAKVGVKQMTFDNADELHKIKANCPDAELFLRILTDDSNSLCRLSIKFGASLSVTRRLLQLAHDLGLNVVGVSFHVGSGAEDPKSFVKAVQDARFVFDQASEIGYDLKVLDVGGGFSQVNFDVFAATLSDTLDEYFPPSVRVIAEPGRYYVASAFTLAANVIGRRDENGNEIEADLTIDPSETYMLYLNDGLYGNFTNIVFDHQHPVAQVLLKKDEDDSPFQYSLWGPTCDGIDVITERISLNGRVGIGSWLYFENMGAYAQCSATRFNGFKDRHNVIYFSSEPSASSLLELEGLNIDGPIANA